MRRIVITVIVLVVVVGMTATEAVANSPYLKRGREASCLVAGSAISKSVSCRGVLARLALSTSAPDNNNDGNTLPYDEFGLGANQPNQPRVGSDGTQHRRDAAGLTAPTSAPDTNTTGNSTLPYDEFGLGANQPNQPRVGSVGP
jgi:hypothetical protein